MENNTDDFQKKLDLTSLENLQRLVITTKNRIKKNPDRKKEILNESEDKLKKISLQYKNREEVPIYERIQNFEDLLKKTGVLFQKQIDSTKNKFVEGVQEDDILNKSIENIKDGSDADEEIEKARKKLKDLGLSDKKVEVLLDNIYRILGMNKKQVEDTEEVLLKDSGDYIPLPKLDTDFLETVPRTNLDPKKDNELFLPKDNSVLNPQLKQLYETDNSYENYDLEKKLNSNTNIFVETENLEEFIRQSKVSILVLPIVISKFDIETEIIKYMSAIRDKFLDIIVFGWEYQENKNYYRRFDEFFQINKEKQGSLFIIRDLKTFNYFAIDAFDSITRNYFLILLEPQFNRDDLASIENLIPTVNYLWPSFADLEIKHKPSVDISVISGDHLAYYREELLKYYKKYNPISKETPSTGPSDEAKIIGKNLLNVYLDNRVLSLGSPGVSINEAINRSPKYRNVVIKIIANSDRRILVKTTPGVYGLDALTYIYGKLKRTPIKPVIIKSSLSAERKKNLIDEIPNNGPCLIITDFSLYDTLTPKNIDYFFVTYGGDNEDLLTYIDICKGNNYPRQIYPRKIELINFISKLDGDLSISYDEEQYKKFIDCFQKIINNNVKLKSIAYNISVRGTSLIVSKDQLI